MKKSPLDLERTPACILPASMTSYSIGEVSEQTGLSVDTLRYYERSDLLVDIGRNGSGHRYYSDADLTWLNLLVCLRSTGMPIADMLRFAKLVRQGDETIGNRLELLSLHRESVLSNIAQMQRKLSVIDQKIEIYTGLEQEKK